MKLNLITEPYGVVPLTRGYVAIVDSEDLERCLASMWWTQLGHNKEPRSISGAPYGKKMGLHRFILGDRPGIVIDHIDGNIFDNRKRNLRYATHSQNSRNQRARVTRRFPYKGIHLDPRWNMKRPWVARVITDAGRIMSKPFATMEEAAREYDRLARLHHGEFARTNFPD